MIVIQLNELKKNTNIYINFYSNIIFFIFILIIFPSLFIIKF